MSAAESDHTSTSTAPAVETVEEVLARHRKETRELTEKITKLKKSAGGSKQKKKEIQNQIAAWERKLAERHSKEQQEALDREPTTSVVDSISLSEPSDLNETNGSAHVAPEESEQPDSIAPSERKRKPNKAALRKARKLEAFEEQRRQAAEEAKLLPNQREQETNALRAVLEEMALCVKEIVPDGHCMYNAVADQLSNRINEANATKADDKSYTYKELRQLAADYMLSHSSDFLPFLTSPSGDLYTPTEYEAYCARVRDTALWGGQLELLALSKALQREIHVLQANTPVVKVGEEFKGRGGPLILSYHRHAYGLGEHYNSLRPKSSEPAENSNT
ncbi:hypothetical protein BC832DRAFT_593297 [Gaertneriomyces semiglobifer]|nr:hypothetical protein BC832DRAFT_593297 [Gaertneriomyces semiglobifer]